jgi:hypothetical protein
MGLLVLHNKNMTMQSKIAALALSILAAMPFGQIARSQSGILDFRAEIAQKKVVLSWTTGKGFFCSSLVFQHSIDSVNYMDFHDYPGVCGSEQQEETYSIIHQQAVLGKWNYYRLILSNTNEDFFSKVFYVVYPDFTFFPNPAQSITTIKISDGVAKKYQLSIYDISGRRKFSITGTGTTAELNVSNWASGQYYFSLVVDKKEETGKLEVIH